MEFKKIRRPVSYLNVLPKKNAYITKIKKKKKENIRHTLITFELLSTNQKHKNNYFQKLIDIPSLDDNIIVISISFFPVTY